MRRDREAGMALVEAILLGLLLIAPLIWGLGVLSALQRAALAASAAARDAGTVVARSTDAGSGVLFATDAAERAFAAQGLDPSRIEVDVAAPGNLARGTFVEVRIEYAVPVFQAPFLGSIGGPSVGVTATHVHRVEPYASR